MAKQHVFVTYDLTRHPASIHSQVKNALIRDYGYSDESPVEGIKMPNTCLRKAGVSREQAVADLKTVVRHYRGTLERYFIAEYEQWEFFASL